MQPINKNPLARKILFDQIIRCAENVNTEYIGAMQQAFINALVRG